MANPVVSMQRRRICLAIAALPFPALATGDPTAGLKRYGSGPFRRWGFLVYDATLWAADDPQQPPLVLQLVYRRTIAGSAIADASVSEMRALGADDSKLARWSVLMQRLFPDVVPEDTIQGVYHKDGARFYHNGKLLGNVAEADEPGFARAFFGIWLDPKTSAPALRKVLLGQVAP